MHHLLRRWYTVFAHVILNCGILYLWLCYQSVDRKLSRNFLVDPSQRQVCHPLNRLLSVCTTHTWATWSMCDPVVFAHLQCGIDPRTLGRMDCDVIDVNSAPDESAKESFYFHVNGSHLWVSLAWSFSSPCFGRLCSHVVVALAWLLHRFPSSKSLYCPLSTLWTILPNDIKSPARSVDVRVMLDWASVRWAFVFFISSSLSLLFVAFSMQRTSSIPVPQGGVRYRERLKWNSPVVESCSVWDWSSNLRKDGLWSMSSMLTPHQTNQPKRALTSICMDIEVTYKCRLLTLSLLLALADFAHM